MTGVQERACPRRRDADFLPDRVLPVAGKRAPTDDHLNGKLVVDLISDRATVEFTS